VAPVLLRHVDADGIKLMLARDLPDLRVSSIRVIGGGRDIRYQALDAENRLYDVRCWDSPCLADLDDRVILKIPTCAVAAEQLARARWARLSGRADERAGSRVRFQRRDRGLRCTPEAPGGRPSCQKLLALPRRQRLDVAASTGRFLAEMHRLLPVVEAEARGYGPPKSTIRPEQLTLRASRLLEREEERNFVSELAAAFARAEAEDWPEVVIHDDLHGSNLLWDPTQERLSGVLDFERCRMYGAVCDLSDAIWRTERGYPVDDGPIAARLERIRVRLS
jgi:hypothetical protein